MLKSFGLVVIFAALFLATGYHFVHSGERLVREIRKVAALFKDDDPERTSSQE